MDKGDQFGFIRTVRLITDGEIPFCKYKSEFSGLTVCIAEVEGPLVSGYLSVATETLSDDGLPHTLEHLVFLGSEEYPYKGILDIFANRCLASGTNAHTGTDRTCYDMSTAGSEGFLKLLPIYVEHLLYPLLTDAAFITEVHHINADGEDSGVVYCEMQAVENTGEQLCYFSMLSAMFPGDCIYKYSHGGRLANLRESTTNEKVKAYHRQFYRPENLCILIVGQVDAKEVFKSLRPIEEKIKKRGQKEPFTRPLQMPVPPLCESATVEMDYPCDEDEFGIALAAWRLPEAMDYTQLISIRVLMDYLTDTSISPMQRDLVESADPFCNDVSYGILEYSVSSIYLHLTNVPVAKLKLLREEIFSLFENLANGTEEFDMKRLGTVIKKMKLNILSSMENRPQGPIFKHVVDDFLYGTTVKNLEQRLQQITTIETLLNKSAEFWKDLIKSYLINGKYIFVLGSPSPKLAAELAEKEKIRIAEQQAKLGPAGLQLNGEMLKKAVEQNEILAPENIIRSISVPSVDSIKYHPVRRSVNDSEESTVLPTEFALDKMPFRFQLDVVKSNFVRMHVLLNTNDVPQTLRMYLPLFVELIIESPICRNGEIIPYQEVVKQLDDETIFVSSSIGLTYSRFDCGKFPQVLCLALMVEEEQYSRGVQWIREILFQTIFEPARIKTIINKMISDVATLRRDGHIIATSMMKNICFAQESNHWTTCMMRQQNFLMELQKTLAVQPDEVVKALNDLRELLTRVDNMTVHLAINLPKLKQKTILEDPWTAELLPPNVQPIKAKNFPKPCYELLKTCNSKLLKGMVVGVGSVESSYLALSAPCISSFTHPDYPALLVVIQYFTQLEGPLWKQLRGMGLTYCYGMSVQPDEGLVCFLLYRSTQVTAAYKEAQKTIESYLNKETPWDACEMESACSSLIFEIVEREETIASVVKQSISAYYKNVDLNFTKSLLENISKVTIADIERVGDIYIRPLFNSDLSNCTICCHPSKVNDIVKDFKQFSYDLTVVPSLEDSLLSQY